MVDFGNSIAFVSKKIYLYFCHFNDWYIYHKSYISVIDYGRLYIFTQKQKFFSA